MRARSVVTVVAAVAAIVIAAPAAFAEVGSNGCVAPRLGVRATGIGVSALGAVSPGTWYEFSFLGPGSMAGAGLGCALLDGEVAADTPPWTLTAGPGGVAVTVTDAWNIGDSFTLLDFGSPVGSTPPVPAAGSCDGAAACALNPAASHATFTLGPGAHSLTIQTVDSPYGDGCAYFRFEEQEAPPAIPAVSTLGALALALLIAALAAVALALRR